MKPIIIDALTLLGIAAMVYAALWLPLLFK